MTHTSNAIIYIELGSLIIGLKEVSPITKIDPHHVDHVLSNQYLKAINY